MNSVLFRSIRIADPESPFDQQMVDIRVKGDRIEEIGAPGSISREADTTFDFEVGTYISPGWVDSMVQLADPGFEYKETAEQLAAAALSGGFGTIICSPNTHPVIDNSQLLHALHSRTKSLPVQFHFCGAITEQAKGQDLAEVYDMHQAGAVAFSDGSHPLPSAGIFLRALQYLKAFNGLIVQTPVDVSLVGDGQMNEGVEAAKLGMPGIPELAELIPVHRDLELYAYEPGKVHFSPISSPKAIEQIQLSRQTFPDISLGTYLYYLILNDSSLQDFDPVYKVFPPLRDESQVTQLKEALKNGQIDILSTGHCAQGIEEKKVEFTNAEPGMLGLQTFFSLAHEHLVKEGWLSLGGLINTISHNPRKIFGLEEVRITQGGRANFTLFHPEQTWSLEASGIPSRAKNSPWIGKEMTGKVLGIYQKGNYVPAS